MADRPATQPQLQSHPAARPAHVRTERLHLAGGARTSLHVAVHDLRHTSVRVVRFGTPTRLEAWCAHEGVGEAIVGGFFVRSGGSPLGEVRTSGIARAGAPFDAPWGARRACVHAAGGGLTVARRDELPRAPPGDLLQAGPLLVRDGVVVRGDDEGFSVASHQFDSDITVGRYPRAALGVTGDRRIVAVACDGRADDEAGLTLDELAQALLALGARNALNLDGGGSTSLVCGGVLQNVPREEHGITLHGGRPVSTALAFLPR